MILIKRANGEERGRVETRGDEEEEGEKMKRESNKQPAPYGKKNRNRGNWGYH
jgi:hypothetical protein